MTFIKCNECDTIIEIKDLKMEFAPELLGGANDENTVHGNDLCAACAARHEAERKAAEEAAAQQAEETPAEEPSEETENE